MGLLFAATFCQERGKLFSRSAVSVLEQMQLPVISCCLSETVAVATGVFLPAALPLAPTKPHWLLTWGAGQLPPVVGRRQQLNLQERRERRNSTPCLESPNGCSSVRESPVYTWSGPCGIQGLLFQT